LEERQWRRVLDRLLGRAFLKPFPLLFGSGLLGSSWRALLKAVSFAVWFCTEV
jgi:hypothetical protein